jgi:hypothetical protein
MRGFSFRFELVRVTVGGVVMTLAAGLFEFASGTRYVAVALFCCGILLVVGGLVRFGKSRVIVHHEWSLQKILKELACAPERATVQILQTWFPEENFLTSLERLYLHEGKRFHLHVMLMNPEGDEADEVNDVLAARMKLRKISRAKAASDITTALDNLRRLKRNVDTSLRQVAVNGVHPESVDLQVRLYDFLPFGPIYKIDDEVMFVGLYLNHVSSVHGPMIEVRKKRCPDLWNLFEEDLSRGWADSTVYFPPRTRGKNNDPTRRRTGPQKATT